MRTGGEKAANILLVAGPGGCGKSTLIRALRAGRLAGSPLPEAARFWPETSAKEILRGDLPVSALHGGDGLGPKGLGPDGLGPEGLIVHYDTMRVLTLGFDEHHDDPAIKIIASAAGPLFAVTVAPPREMLFAQFLARAVVRNDGMDPAQGGLARLKRGLRHWRARAFGPPRVSLSRMQVNMLAIYGSDRKLFQWTQRWEASLDRLAAERGNVHRLIALPAPSAGGAPAFSLRPAPAFQTMPVETLPFEAALRASA